MEAAAPTIRPPAEIRVAQLGELVGVSFSPSAWVLVDQQRIDTFAACTDDHQFIHVDPQRAAHTPFGGTIAHGFLTLALIAAHRPPDFPRVTDLALVVNYGLDRVRFLTPVRSGARVRIASRAIGAASKGPGRVLLTQEYTMQIEGENSPAFIAQQLTLFVAEKPS